MDSPSISLEQATANNNEYGQIIFPHHPRVPYEVAHKIFLLLTFVDFFRISRTCKVWRFVLCQDKKIISEFATKFFPYIKIQNNFTEFGVEWNPWKLKLRQIYQLTLNIVHSSYTTKDDFITQISLTHHSSIIYKLLNHHLLVGSGQGKIVKYNLNESSVKSLVYSDPDLRDKLFIPLGEFRENLYALNEDGNVMIWEKSGPRNSPTVSMRAIVDWTQIEHTSFSNGYLAFKTIGSRRIQIYDLIHSEYVTSIKSNRSPFYFLESEKPTLVYMNSNEKTKKCDIQTFDLTKRVRKDQITMVNTSILFSITCTFSPFMAVVGSTVFILYNNGIYSFDLHKNKVLYSRAMDFSLNKVLETVGIHVVGHFLLIKNTSGQVEVFDFEKWAYTNAINDFFCKRNKSQNGRIYEIFANATQLVGIDTTADYKHIHILDLN